MNHVYLQISKFQPQTPTHQPCLVKIDVSVPSNDTWLELKQGTPAGVGTQRGFLLLQVMFESWGDFGGLQPKQHRRASKMLEDPWGSPIGGQLRLKSTMVSIRFINKDQIKKQSTVSVKLSRQTRAKKTNIKQVNMTFIMEYVGWNMSGNHNQHMVSASLAALVLPFSVSMINRLRVMKIMISHTGLMGCREEALLQAANFPFYSSLSLGGLLLPTRRTFLPGDSASKSDRKRTTSAWPPSDARSKAVLPSSSVE